MSIDKYVVYTIQTINFTQYVCMYICDVHLTVAAPVLDEQTEGHFIMLLHGGGLAIPVHSDVEALGRELRRKEAASAGQEDSLDRSTSR